MHTFNAMNTTVVTDCLPSQARRNCENWFAFVERTLSRFRPESELSRLNHAAGKPFFASALLYEVLSVADRYCKETGGLFNPYLGGVLAGLGYDRSFETLEQYGSGDNAAFASDSHPVLTGFGTISFYLTLLLILSSDFIKKLGKKTWRLIHFLAFPAFGLALAHGLLLGTDAQQPWVRAMYVTTGSLICLLTALRVAAVQFERKPVQVTDVCRRTSHRNEAVKTRP